MFQTFLCERKNQSKSSGISGKHYINDALSRIFSKLWSCTNDNFLIFYSKKASKNSEVKCIFIGGEFVKGEAVLL